VLDRCKSREPLATSSAGRHSIWILRFNIHRIAPCFALAKPRKHRTVAKLGQISDTWPHLTGFCFPAMLAARLEEGTWNRTTRFWAAALLTCMDIAVFQRLFGVIRLAWHGVEWIRVLLLFTLAPWTGSAAFPWRHFYCKLRQFLSEKRSAGMLNAAPMLTKLQENSDV
jgi:hypothetical protein